MSLAAERDEEVLGEADPGPSAASASRRILLVAPRSQGGGLLGETMASAGPQWRGEWAAGGEEALRKLTGEPADVVIADEQLAEMDGVTLLTRGRDRHPTAIRM